MTELAGPLTSLLAGAFVRTALPLGTNGMATVRVTHIAEAAAQGASPYAIASRCR
jgi:hypothetical protein